MKPNHQLRVLLAVCLLFASGAFAQKPDRTKPPELGPPPSLKLPAIQHLTLSNGVPVVLMEKHQVPLVQITLLIKSGTVNDPQRGLASLTAAMMQEGAGSRNALEFADATDFLGANISVSAGMHTTTVSLFTPLSKLDSALALFADAALSPRFPVEELERTRLERLTTLLQWHDEPRIIGGMQFNNVIFGPDHPYGPQAMGNEKTIRSFTVSDLTTFHRVHFRPNNATLIVVGNVTAATILPKLEQLFGKWKSEIVGSYGSSVPAKQIESRKIYLVDKPGAAQSVIRIGRLGVARSTEDFYPLIVMNTILGGSFTSRLNSNLREEHGYSYGAGSRFSFLPLPGSFMAYSDVQTDVTDKALSEFMKELTNITNVSDDEMTRAKNYVALSYPSDFQSVGAVAGRLSDLVIFNLPDNYFNAYTKNIFAVTKDDVVRVAKKYIDPERIAIVIVGDRSKVENGIAALSLGPIEHLTVEHVLGSKPVIENP